MRPQINTNPEYKVFPKNKSYGEICFLIHSICVCQCILQPHYVVKFNILRHQIKALTVIVSLVLLLAY